MERDSIQIISKLKVNDRFCFIFDRKKGIVSEILENDGHRIRIKKTSEMRDRIIRNMEIKVIFLSSPVTTVKS